MAPPKKIIIDTDPGVGRLSLQFLYVYIYIYIRTYYFQFYSERVSVVYLGPTGKIINSYDVNVLTTAARLGCPQIIDFFPFGLGYFGGGWGEGVEFLRWALSPTHISSS